MNKMKYAVIGTSWITEEFIMGAQLVEGLELFGVCSRSYSKGKALAEKFGAPRVFIDLNDLARCGDVEAVYVASPNSLHYEQCKLLLSAGKHVICEKPITVTPHQLSELQALAEEMGRVYMEAIMYMFSPVRPKLKASLKALGNINSAHFDFSQLSSKYPAYKRGENPNIFNPKFATGCLMDLGIYCIYPALDLFGAPKNIISSAKFLSSGADSSGTTVFEYDNMLLTMTWSKVAQDFCGSQILGDEGTVTIGSISQLNHISFCRKGSEPMEVIGEAEKHGIMSHEAQAFYDFATKPEENAEKYREASRMALAVSAVMEQIRKQTGIKFDI
ncbi:MAG: Gfo/Idh/MocA family oxidoreductase [Clostridia bacterium]|nr:Gfo/Idh/MocA family oxidoreductase [Clostridia bacterium]